MGISTTKTLGSMGDNADLHPDLHWIVPYVATLPMNHPINEDPSCQQNADRADVTIFIGRKSRPALIS
jgi:hypothetical protein